MVKFVPAMIPVAVPRTRPVVGSMLPMIGALPSTVEPDMKVMAPVG